MLSHDIRFTSPQHSNMGLHIRILFSTLLTFSILPATHAHQSISYPYPISNERACSIRPGNNCPGPCPRNKLRLDMTPNNPSITLQRGQWFTVNIRKNNHLGGFNRWTLVHVRHIHDRKRHARNAFLFTCGDNRITKCSRRFFSRDCQADDRDEYYRADIQLPKIYPDGVYVLGWVWYGGVTRRATNGDFGDYYDCIYIRVRGGPREHSHTPIFKPGDSATKDNGHCRATVDRVGICWRDPCPGGGRTATLQRPFEFRDGDPRRLTSGQFQSPHQIPSRCCNQPYIRSVTVRSAQNPNRIYASSIRTSTPGVFLTRSMKPTVTCEVGGDVAKVVFYVNGQENGQDFDEPYSIAGDRRDGRTGVVQYFPWNKDIDRKVLTISCRAVGRDGSEVWKTIELSTVV